MMRSPSREAGGVLRQILWRQEELTTLAVSFLITTSTLPRRVLKILEYDLFSCRLSTPLPSM